MRSTLFRVGLAAACSLTAAAPAAWAAYPEKTVTIVVPFPPGGSTDVIARALAARLQDKLGQTFIVDNKAGATGTIGAGAVKRAPAGGYTFLVTSLGPLVIAPHLIKGVPYDAAKDFDLNNSAQRALVDMLVSGLLVRVERADSVETSETRERITTLLNQWDRRARSAREAGESLLYDRAKADDSALLKRFGQSGEGWLVADSMRSVEPNVAVEVREPYEEGSSATDQT